jgi:TRAP-type mannitol/chloroaromatic compound transport system permease large subunit
MTRSGYDVKLSAGLIAAGGTLGILIPPSIMLVVMGPVLEVPVTTLFAAAIVPGIMLALLFTACDDPLPDQPALGPPCRSRHPATCASVGAVLQGLVPPTVLVLAALGSIVFGLATPTEGGACGAVGSLALTAAYGRLRAPTSRTRSSARSRSPC